MEIKEKLLGFICHNFMVETEDINLNESMIDQGIIDSFGLIEIAGFIEEEFSLKIEEDQMNRDNFGSVLKIVDFIKREMEN
jgi:acyl carrier protein